MSLSLPAAGEKVTAGRVFTLKLSLATFSKCNIFEILHSRVELCEHAVRLVFSALISSPSFRYFTFFLILFHFIKSHVPPLHLRPLIFRIQPHLILSFMPERPS
jgi:hypothetical protein